MSICRRWAVELMGSETDQNAWRGFLKPPFNPFVEEIKEVLAERTSGYQAAADHMLSTDGRSINQLVEKILHLLNPVPER